MKEDAVNSHEVRWGGFKEVTFHLDQKISKGLRGWGEGYSFPQFQFWKGY